MSKSNEPTTERNILTPPQGRKAAGDTAAQLAAVSEVMQVLGRSRDNDAPVFQTILTNAVAPCNAQMAGLILGAPQDNVQTLAAQIGMAPMAKELFETGGMKMDPDLSYTARSIVEARLIAFEDMGESELYTAGSPVVRSMVDDSGIRSVLFVPLVGQQDAIGAITLFRDRRAPFSPREIALVHAFAVRAVIAIENKRQFRAVQNQTERERASAEVLEVISASRTDEAPVFDVIMRNVAQLCETDLATLSRVSPDGAYLEYAAHIGMDLPTYNLGKDVWPIDGPMQIAQSVREARVVHSPDLQLTDAYIAGEHYRRKIADDEGIRTMLIVPLLTSDGAAVGLVGLYRKQMRPFDDDEIALAETFAAQAVIAIENARQFTETNEALARQTATANILSVINQNPGDAQPVFDRIATSAMERYGAKFCNMWRVVDGMQHHCATAGFEGADLEDYIALFPRPTGTTSLSSKVIKAGAVQRITNAQDPSCKDYQLAIENGFREIMGVPIRVAGGIWGTIIMAWPSGTVPTEAHMHLMQTFADQAAIAIEHVRLFTET
ncbi:MAG: GAF domain-containing protein [Pseudomonadota bacterium]